MLARITVTWYWCMIRWSVCFFLLTPLIHKHKAGYSTRGRAWGGPAERPQIRPKNLEFWITSMVPGLESSHQFKYSVVGREVCWKTRSDTRSMQAAENYFRVLSKFPQDVISRSSFVSVYNCRESLHVEWAVLGACMWYRYLWLWLYSVCLSLRGLTPPWNQWTKTNTTTDSAFPTKCLWYDIWWFRWIFYGSLQTHMFCKNMGWEYIKLKITHWDLRYNSYQHPCDLMVKPFELQPK